MRTPQLLSVSLAVVLLPGCAVRLRGPAAPPANVVPLVTTMDDGVADSQVVLICLGDREAWLALDTGAPFTFLFSDPAGPEYVEHAGTITIGCEAWQLPGYRDEAIGVEMFQGKPIVGVLGLDFFLDVPAAIDYPGGHLVRYLDGQLPAEDARLPGVPLHGRANRRALVDVVLDGVELTLMLDTGAHDTILIGVGGEDGDESTQLQTADGRVWDARVGEGTLRLPGEEARRVPVIRAPDLAYIAPELHEIHASGLFGLTSLGWRRVVFDFDRGSLRLGPIHNQRAGVTPLSATPPSGAVIVSRPEASPAELLAAREVRRYVYQITGELLSITGELPGRGDAIVLAVDASLPREEFHLVTRAEQGRDVLRITGGSDVAVLYGAYRLAEVYGARFYLHGDVLPDRRRPFTIPDLDAIHAPMFERRGILPFHDFPEGPDWWDRDDWEAYLSQLAKLRMNAIGLHCYPEGGVGPEPLVWIGLPEDVREDGSVRFAAPSRWASTRGGHGATRRR